MTLHNLRAIIFDFGGVLMKTRDYRPRHGWDARLGLSPGSVEQVVHGSDSWRQAQTGQISDAEYWSTVAATLGLKNSDVRQLAADFYSGDMLDAQLIHYIRTLRAGGHTIALLSNDSPALADRLDRLGITQFFDPLVISGQIGVMKPDAAAYQAVLERLQRPADHTIFIDDMLANIEAANALGIHAMHYRDGMDLPAALAELLIINA
jgi:epoxide hydrolase-like predicted phosphatase